MKVSTDKTTTAIVRERFDDFCRLCSLHGLIYLRGDVHLPTRDRIFWLTIFTISIVVSCLAINNVWNTWTSNPLVIVYDYNVRPIWDIPFPSITICSLVGVKRTVLDLQTTTDRKALFFSSLICTSQEYFKDMNLSVTDEEMHSFYTFLDKVTPSCDDMLIRCTFESSEFPCCKVFFPVITNLGRCFVANSLPSNLLFTNQTDKLFLFNDSYPPNTRFWLPEQGFPKPDRRNQEGDKTYPLWGRRSGYEGGLSLEVRQNQSDWQYLCPGEYSGFKIMVNSPEDAPLTSQAALRVPMKRDFLVQLTPRTLRTQRQLYSTSPSLRGCLFQGERPLYYFGIYTQNNCIHECLLEASFEECLCVPFFMPRNSSLPVCSKYSDFECLREVKDKLVARSMAENSEYDDDKGIPWCGCYPACNEIAYSYNTNHGLFLKNSSSLDTENDEIAKITIYYTDRHFLGVHRQQESSFTDFLGTCGGLLGLLMGFSCISAVEVFYHLLLRPLSCIALRPNRKKATTPFNTPLSLPSALAHRLPLRTNKDVFRT